MTVSDVTKDARPRMEAAIEDFRKRISAIRTGRASVQLLDNVVVEYYGTPTPLNQLASIAAPEAQMLTVQPYDSSQLGAIEKAIRNSELGLNPQNDGKMIRVPVPPLTEERRKQFVKQVHDIAEDHRTAIRNIRRDANDKLKKLLKEKTVSEDDERGGTDEVQKMTNTFTTKVDELAKTKEQELMSV